MISEMLFFDICGYCGNGLSVYHVICFTGVIRFVRAQETMINPTKSQTSLSLIAVCI